MKVTRAILFGVLGASAISVASVGFRAVGVPIELEMLLGTAFGMQPGMGAFAAGLVVHLVLGGAIGLTYAWLMETVWKHGGAGMGAILAFIHASMVGMAVGLTPQFHPMVPRQLADPGAYFSNAGTVGVVAFYGVHLLYGLIVGGGYGHVRSESEWAPSLRP
jgi:hypothetical protein